jgi:hypothetical protein
MLCGVAPACYSRGMTETRQRSIKPTVFLVIAAVTWGVIAVNSPSILSVITFLGLFTAAVLSVPSKKVLQ